MIFLFLGHVGLLQILVANVAGARCVIVAGAVIAAVAAIIVVEVVVVVAVLGFFESSSGCRSSVTKMGHANGVATRNENKRARR